MVSPLKHTFTSQSSAQLLYNRLFLHYVPDMAHYEYHLDHRLEHWPKWAQREFGAQFWAAYFAQLIPCAVLDTITFLGKKVTPDFPPLGEKFSAKINTGIYDRTYHRAEREFQGKLLSPTQLEPGHRVYFGTGEQVLTVTKVMWQENGLFAVSFVVHHEKHDQLGTFMIAADEKVKKHPHLLKNNRQLSYSIPISCSRFPSKS